MIHRLLADLVLLLHLAFIAFVLVGGLLALRWRPAPLVHVPAALWGVYIELSGGICPLTPLENWLRRAAGASGYSGGFVEHYVVPLVYPAGLSPARQGVLAGVVLVANLGIYTLLWRRRSLSQSRIRPSEVDSPGCTSTTPSPRRSPSRPDTR